MEINHDKKKISIYCKDSFKDYQREGLNTFPRAKKKPKIKSQKITYTDYRKIIAKFFETWLFNFLWSKGFYYFPFTGEVCKYKTKELFVRDNSSVEVFKKKIFKKIMPTVGMHWKKDLALISRFNVVKLEKFHSANSYMFSDWMKLNNVNHLLTLEEVKERSNSFIKQQKKNP